MNKAMERDAVIVGAGPNGLAAAIVLAQAGKSVLVLEANDTWGGGSRSAELTLPGLVHDTCSAIHPLGIGSPFLRSLPLRQHGLEWIHPDLPLAHPLDDGTAVVLDRSVERTAAMFREDGAAYRRLMMPLVQNWEALLSEVLAPPVHLPRHPVLLARFGYNAIQPADSFARRTFGGARARALFAGLAAHSFLPLNRAGTSAFGLLLGMLGHAVGWPMPLGGSQRLADAMVRHLQSLGGEVRTSSPVISTLEMPQSRTRFFNLTPRQIGRIGRDELPASYLARLDRFQYGAAAFKMDWALSSPIPWRAEECRRAGTIHVGGTYEEIAASESAVGYGVAPERPFVLVAQQSVFDSTRRSDGRHTAWAYCHVPNGSREDMSGRMEAQIERFAPGFRDCIVARSAGSPADLERRNANYVGGDISGGAQTLWQMLARPALSVTPYLMPVKGWYICSSSTPPGGGVHGMCGYNAASAALRLDLREP